MISIGSTMFSAYRRRVHVALLHPSSQLRPHSEQHTPPPKSTSRLRRSSSARLMDRLSILPNCAAKW